MSKTTYRRSIMQAITVFFMGLTLFMLPDGGVQAQPPDGLERVALERVAARTGQRTEQLRVLHSATATYPLQGQSGSAFKIENTRSGEMYGVLLDSAGQELDEAALARAEREAHRARYGRFDPALAERMRLAAPDVPVAVIIWLSEPEVELPQRPMPGSDALKSTADAEALAANLNARRADAVQQVVVPVATRLQGLGFTVTTDSHAPVVYASLSPAALQRVATWEEVDQIYLDGTTQDFMEIVRGTTAAVVVEFAGYSGTGVPIALIERSARVATNNPHLAGITQDTTFVCQNATSHATGIAGIMRSRDWQNRGIAPNANLWVGGTCAATGTATDANLQNRSTAAVNWGARALNLSWGGYATNLVPGAMDRFYDDMVYNRWVTVVPAAGNDGAGCGGTGRTASPALGYNVITVGNFDDHNTVDWADDTMSSCSSWVDPISTHNDREKPEVSAPGSVIDSTTLAAPWIGPIGSGTSFAAPQVTAGAALLMEADFQLRFWPEAIKAIMMAGAYNNIEGAAHLSEVDGAGGIELFASLLMASPNSGYGDWGGHYYQCDTGTPMNVTTMNLTAGERTRVAIAWSTNDDYVNYTTRPDADLDLHILGPNGEWITGSFRYDNTAEIVDFTPPTSGTYTVRVSKFRCDHTNQRWLGWAWHTGGSIGGE
jgi:hypothetical protein